MRVIGFLMSLVSLFASVPACPHAEDAAESPEKRYADCMNMAETAPDKAIDHALAWIKEGGGVPARHCEATGLFFGKDYAEAAIRLEGLTEDMRLGRDMPLDEAGHRRVAKPALLADIYGQAAEAWLLAGEVGRAQDMIAPALSIVPEGTILQNALLIKRARISAGDEDFESALNDLTRALTADPGRKDILIFMAAAARAIGDLERALIHIEAYQEAYANDPVGFLELGHAFDGLGRTQEARRAYLKVIDLAQSQTGADPNLILQAQANLARLDIKNRPDN